MQGDKQNGLDNMMEILEKAWNDFLKYYDKKARKYTNGMDDIEIHLNKRINKENFKNYSFSENKNETLKDAKSKEIKVFHSKSFAKSP